MYQKGWSDLTFPQKYNFGVTNKFSVFFIFLSALVNAKTAWVNCNTHTKGHLSMRQVPLNEKKGATSLLPIKNVKN